MLSDSGASGHSIDDRLLAGVEGRMKNYVDLKPPMIITTAGGNKLEGVAQGILQVDVRDSKGIFRNVSLPLFVDAYDTVRYRICSFYWVISYTADSCIL